MQESEKEYRGEFKRNSDMEYLQDIPVIKKQLQTIEKSLEKLDTPLNQLTTLVADVQWLKWWNNIEVGAIITICVAVVLMILKMQG